MLGNGLVADDSSTRATNSRGSLLAKIPIGGVSDEQRHDRDSVEEITSEDRSRFVEREENLFEFQIQPFDSDRQQRQERRDRK